MLNKKEIERRIQEAQLIEDYIDLKVQLTPNGFDITAAAVFRFSSPGALDFSNSERVLPQAREIAPEKKQPADTYGWWHLERGAYKVRTNEIINLPTTLVALAYTRTSLLRMGAFTQHGVWDAGFCGRGEFILVVENPLGIALKQNARVAQLVFLNIEETSGYDGIYKHLR